MNRDRNAQQVCVLIVPSGIEIMGNDEQIDSSTMF